MAKKQTTQHERTYLIMYDIRDATRLRKIHKICKQYGLPQQYSVFESRMTQRKFLKFLREVDPIIKYNEDQLVCMPICSSCRQQIRVIGQSWDFTHEDSCIIV